MVRVYTKYSDVIEIKLVRKYILKPSLSSMTLTILFSSSEISVSWLPSNTHCIVISSKPVVASLEDTEEPIVSCGSIHPVDVM